MEFSFGTQKWFPKESLSEMSDGRESHALGLHAPGFFDKVLNVDKCLLQSEPANEVFPDSFALANAENLGQVDDCWHGKLLL